MKNLLKPFLVFIFLCTLSYPQASFSTSSFYVYSGYYGNIKIGTLSGQDTLEQFETVNFLVSGAPYQVFDAFNDALDVIPTTLTDSTQNADFEISGSYDTSFSGNPPAILLNQTIYGWIGKKYVVVRLNIKNMEQVILNSFIGLDIASRVDNSYDNDSVRFNQGNQVLYLYDTSYVGVKLLNKPVHSAYIFPWYDVYFESDSNYYRWLSGGIKDSMILGTNEDGAVAILGTPATDINPGDSIDVYYAIALGNDETAMLENIAEAESRFVILTSVNREDASPLSYNLEQNYPNPFNSISNFGFRIADLGHVEIKVYDVLANEIATLVNEERPAGEYTIRFDANGLASGVYYYQMRVNGYVQTKKMILLK